MPQETCCKPNTMRALRTIPPKIPNSSSSSSLLFYITSRFFTLQNPNPFPDGPTAAYYDDLINAAGRNRDFDAVHHLLNKRFRDCCLNTNNTFKFISAADLSFLDDLSQTLARLDQGFTRKSAYDSLIARFCKLHLTDEALRVADAMIRSGHGANACTFHPVLNALTRTKMEDAWRVMELMRENQIPPDLTAYNYLLKGYCFAGDLTAAAGVLTAMWEQGMKADARTYDALVMGACKAGKVEGAMVVLRRMEDHGVSPLYCTHTHVIGGLLRLGGYEQAMAFVMSYAGRDEKLDTNNFGILANRLINLRKFDEAKIILKEMKNRGLAMGHKLKNFYLLHMEG